MKEAYKISFARVQDADQIHNLMKQVYDALQDKRIFFCDDLEYVKEHIKELGFAVKVESDGELVASLIVRFPMDADDNLGRDVGIMELRKVAHLESIVVGERHRGHGLQDKMIKFAEQIILDRGFAYIMATVSPDNLYSLRNFEKNGYRVMMIKEKYGGLKRAILSKNKELQL